MKAIPVGARSSLVTILGWGLAVPGACVALVFAALSLLQGGFWALGAATALALLMIALGVGLLRRFDWARRAIIGLLGVVVAMQFTGAWLQLLILQGTPDASGHTNTPGWWAAFSASLGLSPATAAVLTSLATLALCAPLIWAIVRLMSRRIRLEFVS